MNITTTFDRPEPVLVSPIDVPVGRVYSWGSKQVSYLRVEAGSVCLSGTYELLPILHTHFNRSGPRVTVCTECELTIRYPS